MLTYSFHAFKQLAADLNLQSDLVNWRAGMFYTFIISIAHIGCLLFM